MREFTIHKMRHCRRGLTFAKPVLKRQGGNGVPPTWKTATAAEPDDGHKPGGHSRRKSIVNQGRRIEGLVVMAHFQKNHPHSYLNDYEKSSWKARWLWVIIVLIVARSLLLGADESVDPISQRGIIWELIGYAKRQAADVHARFPRRHDVNGELATYHDASADEPISVDNGSEMSSSETWKTSI